MATQSSFKQQCPSCEAMVPIRDPKLIGRKIDCPKCKYRFVVEEPVDDVETVEDEPLAKKGKGGSNAITTKKPAGGKAVKPSAQRRADDDEDLDDEKPKKKKSGGSGMLIAGIALAAVALIALAVGFWMIWGSDKESGTSSSKSSGGPTASVTPPPPGGGNGGDVKPPEPQAPPKEVVKPKQEDVTNLLPNDTQAVVNLPLVHLFNNGKIQEGLLKTPGAFHEGAFQRVWGITPSDVNRVVLAINLQKKSVFSVMRTTQPMKEDQIVAALKIRPEPPIGGLKYYLIKKPLDAFSNFLLKGMVHRDSVALHFMDPVTVVCADGAAMQQFLQEKGQPKQLSKPPVEEQPRGGGGMQGGMPGGGMQGGPPGGMQGGPPGGMQGGPPGGMQGGPPGGMQGGPPQPPGGPGGAQKPPGGPGGAPQPPGGGGPPQPPGGGGPPQPPGGGGPPQPPGGGPPGMMMPPGMMPPGGGNASSSTAAAASTSYMSVDPNLKAVLDQVEKIENKDEQKVLVSLAVSTSGFTVKDIKQLVAALSQIADKPPEVSDLKLFAGLEVFKSEVKALGLAVLDFSETKISVNGAVFAKDAKLASKWQTETNTGLPVLFALGGLDFVSKNPAGMNGMQGGMPGGMQGGMPMGMQGGMPAGMPGGMPNGMPRGMQGGMPNGMPRGMQPPPGGFPGMQPPGGFPGMQPPGGDNNKEEETKGKNGDYLTWTKDNVFALGLNVTIDAAIYTKVGTGLEYLGIGLRSISAMSDARPCLHELAAATQAYLEKEGHFPRGAVPRAPDAQRVLDWRPDQRLSWLTQLLPYLANGEFKNMKFENDKGWYDDPNDRGSLTLIPQFLAPKKEDNPFENYLIYPNMIVPGINGNVRVVAAATHFVGIAGVGLDAAEYRADDPATAKLRGVFGYDRETKKEEIKDGLENTIVAIQVPPSPRSPWTAGGGSTVRGVSPDLDCVQPFVCTEYEGKRGTFAIMADGKVRFIPATLDPKTFQAMCTIAGGERIKNLDDIAPEVPPPEEAAGPELKAEQPAPPPVDAKQREGAVKRELPAGWKEIVSKEGRFRVAVPPGAAKENTMRVPSAIGELVMHQMGIELPGNVGAFMAQYTDLPAKVDDVDAFLKNAQAGMLGRAPGGRVSNEKKITFSGRPGREFEVLVPGKTSIKTRMYLDNNRFYVLGLYCSPGKVPEKDFQTFIDSFQITTP